MKRGTLVRELAAELAHEAVAAQHAHQVGELSLAVPTLVVARVEASDTPVGGVAVGRPRVQGSSVLLLLLLLLS